MGGSCPKKTPNSPKGFSKAFLKKKSGSMHEILLGTSERSYNRGYEGGVCPGKTPQGPAWLQLEGTKHICFRCNNPIIVGKKGTFGPHQWVNREPSQKWTLLPNNLLCFNTPWSAQSPSGILDRWGSRDTELCLPMAVTTQHIRGRGSTSEGGQIKSCTCSLPQLSQPRLHPSIAQKYTCFLFCGNLGAMWWKTRGI